MTRLILIRHGETETNTKGILHKTNDEATLTELGKKQIIATAKRLSSLNVNKIFSSDETRALESARKISEELNLDLNIIPEIKERNWGKLEGKPWSKISIILDPLSLEERYNYVPPNGESWKGFETRIFGAITKIVSTSDKQSIAIVTHSGVIRALIPKLLNIPKEESFKYDPENASISIFHYNNGSFSEKFINDTKHLKDI